MKTQMKPKFSVFDVITIVALLLTVTALSYVLYSLDAHTVSIATWPLVMIIWCIIFYLMSAKHARD